MMNGVDLDTFRALRALARVRFPGAHEALSKLLGLPVRAPRPGGLLEPRSKQPLQPVRPVLRIELPEMSVRPEPVRPPIVTCAHPANPVKQADGSWVYPDEPIKPLTAFEHREAKLALFLRGLDDVIAEDVNRCQKGTDLDWYAWEQQRAPLNAQPQHRNHFGHWSAGYSRPEPNPVRRRPGKFRSLGEGNRRRQARKAALRAWREISLDSSS